jgi:hypothetical protein
MVPSNVFSRRVPAIIVNFPLVHCPRCDRFCCDALSPLLAQSGHDEAGSQCLLLEVKRTSARRLEMSAYDPKRCLGMAYRAILDLKM